MGDIESAARGARDKLAAALSLLNLPAEGHAGASIALPLARASGALYRVETSATDAAGAAVLARDSIRRTLAILQDASSAHLVREDALEIIAGCLGITHQLAEILGEATAPTRGDSDPKAPFQPVPVDRRPPQQAPSRSYSPPHQPAQEPPRGRGAGAHMAAPGGVTVMRSGAAPQGPDRTLRTATPGSSATLDSPDPVQKGRDSATAPGQNAPVVGKRSEGARGKREASSPGRPDSLSSTRVSVTHDEAPPRGVAVPLDVTSRSAGKQYPSTPEARKHHGQTMESRRSDGPTSKHARGPGTIPKADALVFEANLGAHSATNFYKGLSGNDVVDHGGIFVASYQIPLIGTPLWLRVTMPGGYDFEASAHVAWTRDSATPEAPPGFGATFDKLSDGARQLVYRYARNREPLFHDEM